MDSVSQSRDPRSTVMVGVPRGPRDSVALAGGKKDENIGGKKMLDSLGASSRGKNAPLRSSVSSIGLD